MTEQSDHGQEAKFVFVGGPLMNKGGPLRGRAIRQGRRDTKQQRRIDAAIEVEELLREGTNPECTCYRASPAGTGRIQSPHLTIPPAGGSGSSELQGFRPIKPKAPSQAGPRVRKVQGQFCSLCGRYLRVRRSPTTPSVALGSVFDLGAGNHDPILPKNEVTSQLKVQEILHFAGTQIWPNFRPLRYTSDCYQSWVVPYNDKLMLYATLWSASYHLDVLHLTYGNRDHQRESKEQLYLKGLTLQMLRGAIETYTTQTPIDGIIMCILYLAVNDTVEKGVRRDPSPFTPLFTGLHSLDFYGSRDYHPLHWIVIQDLLGRLGGITVLRAHGVAWLLSIADIMNAAHAIRKPIYPCLGVDGSVLNLDPPLRLFTAYGVQVEAGSQHPGSGFRDLLSLLPPVRPEHVTALANIGELSYVLQSLSDQPCSPKALDILGDSRNLVHHRLFSLPDENNALEQIVQSEGSPEAAIADAERQRTKEIYLTARLAALLFAIHVTFPIPRSSLVSGTLLKSLCPKLLSLVEQGVSNGILLWSASVALIASDGKPLHKVMMKLFLKLCHDLEIASLDELLQVLRSFAWMDAAVEHHYQGQWKDIFPAVSASRAKTQGAMKQLPVR
ncbi:hypothetical protein BJX68DRAFT_269328 [Aspergillus pseudodeflectus]|uniref:Uncharacterized protein n=1 Tax=Aspergillus pseudodeflectus TaxID=176178 RepID=A0ABR4JYJ8_9EURO